MLKEACLPGMEKNVKYPNDVGQMDVCVHVTSTQQIQSLRKIFCYNNNALGNISTQIHSYMQIKLSELAAEYTS